MNETTEKTETVRIVRSIKAPAEKVYEAFLDPEQLVQWIGPGGPGATRVEAEATVGGVIDIWVAKEEGEKLHFHWEIAEMDPPNRLVFDFAFGGPIGSELTDERSRLTFEFREDGTGSTELTLVHDRLSTEVAANVTSGWTTITDRLTDYLEAKAPSNEVTGKD